MIGIGEIPIAGPPNVLLHDFQGGAQFLVQPCLLNIRARTLRNQ